jgi:hypothetical protein
MLFTMRARLFALTILINATACLLSGQAINSDTRLQQLQQFDRFFDISAPNTDSSNKGLQVQDESGETDMGEQRILLSKEEPKHWRLFADNALIHVTNAFLTSGNAVSDTYYAGTVGAQYHRSLSNSFAVTAVARQQFFRYFEHSALDFNHTSFTTRAQWVAPKSLSNVLLWGQWQWNSLTNARSNPSGVSFGDEFLRYHTFSIGAQKTFFLDDYNLLFLGTTAQFGLTEKSRSSRQFDPQKDTYSLFVGYYYQYSRSLSTQVGYYLSRNVYDHLRTASGKHRRDWNHTVSAAAVWKFNPWLSAGTNLSYIWNESNERFFHYENGNVGLNLELNYRF